MGRKFEFCQTVHYRLEGGLFFRGVPALAIFTVQVLPGSHDEWHSAIPQHLIPMTFWQKTCNTGHTMLCLCHLIQEGHVKDTQCCLCPLIHGGHVKAIS